MILKKKKFNNCIHNHYDVYLQPHLHKQVFNAEVVADANHLVGNGLESDLLFRVFFGGL